MKFLGNLLWFIFGGFIISIVYFLSGILLCLTIIGIPFGMQLFKFANYSLFPFGRTTRYKKGDASGLDIIMDILWLIFGGFEVVVLHLILAFIFFITIIGIPFAKQHIKLAKIAFFPFGRRIVNEL